MSPERQMTITELLGKYRSAILMLLPTFDEVGIGWREWERYDGIDRIENALFESIVCDAFSHEFCPPPIIGFSFDPKKHSLLYDQTLGYEYAFSFLKHGEHPFDTACFTKVADKMESEVDEKEKLFSSCIFIILPQKYKNNLYRKPTVLANIGSYGSKIE